MNDHDRRFAEAVRAACLAAAREAYEDAGLRGLCAEGRWEAAIDAVEAIDLDAAAHDVSGPSSGRPLTRRGPL